MCQHKCFICLNYVHCLSLRVDVECKTRKSLNVCPQFCPFAIVFVLSCFNTCNYLWCHLKELFGPWQPFKWTAKTRLIKDITGHFENVAAYLKALISQRAMDHVCVVILITLLYIYIYVL